MAKSVGRLFVYVRLLPTKRIFLVFGLPAGVGLQVEEVLLVVLLFPVGVVGVGSLLA